MYFTHPEITPHNRQGDFRFNKSGERVSRFASKEAEVRALVEGQFMAKRIHAEKMGFKIGMRKAEMIKIIRVLSSDWVLILTLDPKHKFSINHSNSLHDVHQP